MAENSTAWTDELKAEVKEEYTSREPTPENTMEIVAELAEEYDKTVNGMRMILTKAGVYVKKTPAKAEKKEGGTGAKRVNKQEAIDGLKAAISEIGATVDEDIISRLTGKAANYFTEVINSTNGSD